MISPSARGSGCAAPGERSALDDLNVALGVRRFRPPTPPAQLDVAISHNNFGHVAVPAGDHTAARERYATAIELLMARFGAEDPAALEIAAKLRSLDDKPDG